MVKFAYEVVFDDGTSVEEWGRTPIEATIIAQANRINSDRTYTVTDCKYIGRVPTDRENRP